MIPRCATWFLDGVMRWRLLRVLELWRRGEWAIAACLVALPADLARAAERGPFLEPATAIFGSVVDARAQSASEGDGRANLTPRGLVVRAGPGHWAVFDVDLLRWSAMWEGDAVTPVSMAQGSYAAAVAGQKAPEGQDLLPVPRGKVDWITATVPGWHHGDAVTWRDNRPRAEDPAEVGLGPMDRDQGRFRAWGTDGRGPWVEYEVAGSLVRERLFALAVGAGAAVWIREFECAPCTVGRRILVGECLEGSPTVEIRSRSGEQVPPQEMGVVTEGSRRFIQLPPHASPRAFRVWMGAPVHVGASAHDPAAMSIARGSRRWPETVSTTVEAGREGDSGVVVDGVGLPVENPWGRHVRLSDLAFRADGRAALVTFDGDVWWVDGLSGQEGSVRWRRFATGLHEPLSLVIRSNRVEVFDRNGIWRLHDLDGDDECDRFELVSNAFAQTAETREYANSMELAPDGSYLIAKGGQQGSTTGRHNGMVLRVREGAAAAEVLAYGLRQPFLGVHPRSGWITATDQQGHYVPTTPIHEIGGGRFHGFLSLRLPKERYPAPIAEPLLWIPHAVNASAASQVWLVDSRMGALDGTLIHLGYYRPELFVVRTNARAGQVEAAVMSLTRDLRFAPLQGAVNPADGLLYVCGFQIWGSEAPEISGLARVRPPSSQVSPLPVEIAALREGILLRFGMPLDVRVARDPSRYFVERWNYVRSANYGSGHYRLDGTRGQEVLPPRRIRVSQNRRAVLVELADLRPVMQMRVAWTLQDAEGRPLSQSACLTPRGFPGFDAEREGFGEPEDELPVAAGAVRIETPVTPEEGRRLADLMGCVACHSGDGSLLGKVGPSWKGLYGAPRRFTDGTSAMADEAYLRQSMQDPTAHVVEGFDARDTGMPSYAGVLTRDQESALIAYIATLR